MTSTTPYKRIDREALVQFLEERMADKETYSLVARAIFEGIRTRVERGDFDLPDQKRCSVCGRFTKTPHQHPKNERK